MDVHPVVLLPCGWLVDRVWLAIAARRERERGEKKLEEQEGPLCVYIVFWFQATQRVELCRARNEEGTGVGWVELN